MRRFRGKYRPESQRLRGWHYDEPGWYFVTICTHGRAPQFGDVVEEEVVLSPIGEIVAEEWLKAPQIRPNVELDDFIIMPNHLHGIVIIRHKLLAPPTEKSRLGTVETPRRGVSTRALAAWKPGSLGAIINQFKSICTKRIGASALPTFAWQRGYYDHIIRDDRDLARIRRYIRLNPTKWHLDRYYRAP